MAEDRPNSVETPAAPPAAARGGALSVAWRLALAALVLAGLYAARLHSYLLFHSLAELFSVVVAAAVFMIAWNARRFQSNGYVLWIGIGLLSVAALDLAHALAYSGMSIFADRSTNLPTQLWMAARFVEAAVLLAAPVWLTRRLWGHVTVSAFTVVTAAVLWAVFGWSIYPGRPVFPLCYDDAARSLTTFKIVGEYAVGAVLAASAVLLYLPPCRGRLGRRVRRLLAAAIVATVASEMAFTLYRGPAGPANVAGHYLKIIAFFLIYKAVIETALTDPYQLLFRDLKRSEEAHRDSEERYRTLVETSPDAITVHGDGRCVYANPAAVELFGAASADQLVGGRTLDLFHPAEHAEAARRLAGLPADGLAPQREARILRLDGQAVDVESSKAAIRFAGSPAVQVTMRDIRARKQFERQRERLIGALQRVRQALERRVRQRTGELATALADLKHETADRERAESELARIGEQERRRIGQDLHDSLGQQLAGIGFLSKVLQKRLAEAGSGQAQDAATIASLVSQTIALTRSLAHGLCPVREGPDGLAEALESLAVSTREVYGVRCEFHCPQPVAVADHDVAVHLYHIAQEATNNALKHAGPKSIRLELAGGDGQACLTVRDDGAGFDAAAPTGGLGLGIMRHRARMIGGTLRIAPWPGGGTVVTCRASATSPGGAAGSGQQDDEPTPN